MPIKEIGNFTISYYQVLDEEGNIDKSLDPGLSDKDLLKLYRSMVLAREVDKKMLNLQRQGRVGTFGPNTGQEASAAASAFATTEKDWFVGAFRELGSRLVRGEHISKTFTFHNGFEEGNYTPEAPRTLPVNIIVGSQFLHAAGIGYAMKYKGEKDSAVVVYGGDGSTSQGDFYEGMNFAGVWKAPVVFIIQNNQWAISLPREQQTAAGSLAQKAIAAGIHGVQVDGSDALAVYKATREALDRAYAGEGPTLIEAITYRLMMHTTADDPKKYRTPESEEEWWKKEPLIRFKLYLEKKGIWDDKKQKKLDAEIKIEVDAAIKEFEDQKDFKPDACFDHVFGTKHDIIENQRADFLEEMRKEADNG